MKDQCFSYMMDRFESADLISVIINPSSMLIININKMGAKFYGYAKEELINQSFGVLLLDEKSVEFNGVSFNQILGQSNTFSHYSKHMTKTKEIKEVEVVSVKVDTNDTPVLFLFIYDRTYLIEMNNKLQQSEEKFQRLLMDIPSISVQGYYLDGTTFYWNKASEEIYGYSEEEAIGNNFLDLIIPFDMRAGVVESIKQSSITGIPPEAGELQLMSKNGSTVDVFSSHAILAFDDKPLEMFCIDIDISERKIARQLRLAANVFTHAVEPILIADANAKIVDVNQRFTEIFGYNKNEIYNMNPNILKSGLHDEAHYEKMWDVLIQTGSWTGEVYNKKKNGEIIPMLIRINAVKDAKMAVQNYICFYTDLTYIKKHQEELERAAFFDSLTGLPNRTLFYKRLLSAMVDPRNKSEYTALVYLDLDGFKEINDNYGHDVGDYFLKEVSKSMQHQLREGDTLARLGGDEFVVILVGLKRKTDLTNLLDRLLKATSKEVPYLKTTLKVSASIGAAIYPDNAVNPDALIRMADEAMYIAKKNGKNKYVIC